MEFDLLTLFPRILEGPLDESILKRAREKDLVKIRIHNVRDFTHDKHRVVDDKPYGGGPGMLMKPEPIFEAVESVRREDSRVILMTPQGRRLDQDAAQRLTAYSHLVVICGHYEGVDERVREALVDEEMSIGDYILTNGALAAAVLVDAVTRLLPGVLGDDESATRESFSDGLLEYPQYTRPMDFRGMKVPEVLVSGDHAAIARWQQEQASRRTREQRPDLITNKDHDKEM